MSLFICFFFNDTATTEIYTLSLHDALPIYRAADPQDPPGVVLPELLGAEEALRAGAVVGGPAGLCVRRVDPARRPARGEPRAAGQPVGGQPDRKSVV